MFTHHSYKIEFFFDDQGKSSSDASLFVLIDEGLG